MSANDVASRTHIKGAKGGGLAISDLTTWPWQGNTFKTTGSSEPFPVHPVKYPSNPRFPVHRNQRRPESDEILARYPF